MSVALNPAAAEGEWRNAAVMLVKQLREEGVRVHQITEAPPARIPEPEFRSYKMRFGKHKGKILSSLPAEYLTWMLDNMELREPLVSYIAMELDFRLGKTYA